MCSLTAVRFCTVGMLIFLGLNLPTVSQNLIKLIAFHFRINSVLNPLFTTQNAWAILFFPFAFMKTFFLTNH